MANFPADKELGLARPSQRLAIEIWAIPLFVTSIFSTITEFGISLTAAGLALGSCAPLAILVWKADAWFALSSGLRLLFAFLLGALRAVVALGPTQLSVASLDEYLVAGVFALLWWFLVQQLANEQARIERKFAAITVLGKSQYSSLIDLNLSSIFSRHSLFQSGQDSLSSGGIEIPDKLALIAIEEQVSAAAAAVGGFRSIQALELPRLRLSSSLRNALKTPRFDLGFAVTGFTVLVATGSFSNYDFGRAFLSVGLSVGIFSLLLLGWKSLRAVNNHLTSRIFVGLVVLALPVIGPDLILQSLGYQSELGNWEVSVGVPLTIAGVTIGAAVLSQLRKQRRELVGVLATSLADQEVLALYLHNSLKSEVAALVMQLESAEGEARVKIWERLRASLVGDFESEAKKSIQFPLERFQAVLESWSPILRIDASSLVNSGAADSVVVARLAEEAIANAARHAQASYINFTVRRESDTWAITIENDGIQTENDSRMGFGLRFLELVSESWSLRYIDGKHRLTIRLFRDRA